MMNEPQPLGEIELARQRLQRSREKLQVAFAGDGSGEGGFSSSSLLRGVLFKGVQMMASGRSPLSAVGPVISLATLLLPLLLRRRARAPSAATSLIGPLALAALSLFRRR